MVYPRRVNILIVPCSIQYCLSIPIDCIIKYCNSLHILTPDSKSIPSSPHPPWKSKACFYDYNSVSVSCCCIVAKSRRLFRGPMDYSHWTPLSMRSPRQEYWSGLPFPSPGALPDPEIEPTSPALQVDSLVDSTYIWYHMIFVFLFLTYFT